MGPIICSKDPQSILNAIKDYLNNGTKNIQDILLVEINNEQIIFLVDSQPIDADKAKIWWNGYSAGLKSALE